MRCRHIRNRAVCTAGTAAATVFFLAAQDAIPSMVYAFTPLFRTKSSVISRSSSSSVLSTLHSNMASNSSDETTPAAKHVVIAGAGIGGTATAYYLVHNHGERVASITLVDPTGTIAPAASGKAGGFLAKDWNDGFPTGLLTRRSFELHQQLANALGAESIQYRRLSCAAIGVDPARRKGGRGKPSGTKLQGIEWAVGNDDGTVATSFRSLGTEETIAQVHPRMLCERLWEESCRRGRCELKKGKVIGAVRGDEDKGRLVVRLDDDTALNADAVLFACGAWTADIMLGVKYHSAVVRTDRVLGQCVFFSGCGDPEVYVRPDQTAYCTGFPEPARVVAEPPGQERVLPEKIAAILESVKDATAASESFELQSDPIVQQACYLPTTDDGIPVIGSLREEGCFIAAGHSCWGILLGPATGESMASLIALGKETEHVDLRGFSPGRYRAILPVPL
jgi:glycine/D-amino acid oxidase-like deaminating enzyme